MVLLRRYLPELRQRAHTHDTAHISLVLAGGVQEVAGRTELEFGAGRLAFRPAGMRHACAFSRRGALILTCDFPHEIAVPRWSRPLSRERLRTLTPLLLADDADAREALWDLVALAADELPRSRPSTWLTVVRDQLIEEPDTAISAIAAAAGRHRVHLARAFLAAFGETPSVFRRRAMVDRALCALAAGASFAHGAAEAGFADQSHFNRACRELFGMTPRRLLRGATDVSSVQYRG
jgi:AraC family transcriptional regulator